MNRRAFIRLLGGAASGWPFAVKGQQPGSLIRLGILGPTLNNPASTVPYEAFRTVLGESGFREGQNLTIKRGRSAWPLRSRGGVDAFAAGFDRCQWAGDVAAGGHGRERLHPCRH